MFSPLFESFIAKIRATGCFEWVGQCFNQADEKVLLIYCVIIVNIGWADTESISRSLLSHTLMILTPYRSDPLFHTSVQTDAQWMNTFVDRSYDAYRSFLCSLGPLFMDTVKTARLMGELDLQLPSSVFFLTYCPVNLSLVNLLSC